MGFGGYFQNLMAAAIFMTLGLGVDDAFVIVDAVDAVDDDDDDLTVGDAAAAKLSEGLRSAGASILLTSCTDCAAFAACAATSNIPALTSFCGVAALCVACDFALQVTFGAGNGCFDVGVLEATPERNACSPRAMIARPKMSQIEWKSIEI